MSGMFSFPAGRRGKWIVLLVWFAAVVGVIGADLPGKFTDAEENESTSFLPGDAESTKALEVTEQLNEGDIAPTVIVYRRDGGLTAADRTQIRRDVAELNRITARYENTPPFRQAGGPPDGRSPLTKNNSRAPGGGGNLIAPVKNSRTAVSARGGGLRVKVADPAGISADAIKVFENINGTLVGA